MFICPRSPGHPVPHVSVYPNLTEFEAELAQEDEECFGWATARLVLQEISLEIYFERLIDHIREGGARHTWDKTKTNLQHALQVDLIAGAFKARMLKKALGKISAAGESGHLTSSQSCFCSGTSVIMSTLTRRQLTLAYNLAKILFRRRRIENSLSNLLPSA